MFLLCLPLHILHLVAGWLTLGGLVAAVEKVADELEDAYMDLGDEWQGEKRGKFLEMMITDGCFLLEVMRTVAGKESIPKDYAHGDPIFSWYGIQHIKPFIQRDMLMVENQLPLRLLETIVAMEDGTCPMPRKGPAWDSRTQVRSRVTERFFTEATKDVSVVRPESVVPRSAWKLSEAGIQFLPSKTSCLDNIELYMPKVEMDDSTTYRIHNMMAFEAMHVGTGNDVTTYVLFVKDLINSADDVQLLERKGILEHDLADDDNAVVRLFNSLTRDVSKNWKSQLCQVRQDVDHHYRNNHLRVFLYGAWSNLRNKYFKSLWTLLALVTAILLVVGDIVQAVYAVISYDPNEKGKPKMN
uniref:Uncharacterized protein n=1 Tax=Aegilops tauschii TaxID=37682 RepID=M8BMI9_AEGTA